MQISEFLRPENVIVGLGGGNKRSVLEALCGRIAALSGGDEAAIFAALDNREKLGSTGMGRGIAIPHATVGGIDRPVGLLARLNRAVDFDAIDEAPVDIVFVLLVPERDRAAGLKLLSAAARILRSDAVVARIRAAGDAMTLYDAVATSEG